MSQRIRGACLCGAVRFTIAPPYRWFAHCHCSMCRKHHGSLFGTFLGVASAEFRWDEDVREIVHYRATDAFERPFCSRCGSTVPGISDEPNFWNVPAGLVDGDPGARPRSHIFVASRSPLTALDDALPRHDAYPPGKDLPTLATRASLEAATVSGSCLCGAVTFAAAAAPKLLINCYCSLCRRSRAAAFAGTLPVPRWSFAWRSGLDGIRSYALPAPCRYSANFCGDCGSPVPCAADGSAVVMLPAGAIDTPLPQLPTLHVYVASKAPWCTIPATGEKFDELAPPQRLNALFE